MTRNGFGNVTLWNVFLGETLGDVVGTQAVGKVYPTKGRGSDHNDENELKKYEFFVIPTFLSLT